MPARRAPMPTSTPSANPALAPPDMPPLASAVLVGLAAKEACATRLVTASVEPGGGDAEAATMMEDTACFGLEVAFTVSFAEDSTFLSVALGLADGFEVLEVEWPSSPCFGAALCCNGGATKVSGAAVTHTASPVKVFCILTTTTTVCTGSSSGCC
jgi:hypothetical protein